MGTDFRYIVLEQIGYSMRVTVINFCSRGGFNDGVV